MRLLVDTRFLVWGASEPHKVSRAARALIEGADRRVFSVASIWEVAVKTALGRGDLRTDPLRLRDDLLRHDEELEVPGRHAVVVVDLPPHHGEPFDRLLVAQARLEGLILLTADRVLAAYGTVVRLA